MCGMVPVKIFIELMRQRQESRRFKLVNGVTHTHLTGQSYVLTCLNRQFPANDYGLS